MPPSAPPLLGASCELLGLCILLIASRCDALKAYVAFMFIAALLLVFAKYYSLLPGFAGGPTYGPDYALAKYSMFWFMERGVSFVPMLYLCMGMLISV